MSLTLEERLERLEDVETIKKLAVEYGRGADRKNDPATLRELFEEDCVWESPQFGRYEGLEQLIEATSMSSRDRIVWTLHFNVSITVDLDETGRAARCRWHLWEPMKLRQDDGSDAETWFGATYDTTWRKHGPGCWKMSYLLLEARLFAKVGDPWPGMIGDAVAEAHMPEN